MLLNAGIIALLGLLGGIPPLLIRRTDRVLHLLIAFATGVFLGAVFLHLLPHVAEMAHSGIGGEEPEAGHGVHVHGGGHLWYAVLASVLGLFLIENLLLRHGGSGDRERHRTVGLAALVGLCLHAFAAGIALSAAVRVPEIESALLVSIVCHKVVESFSLATVFLLAGLAPRRILLLVAGFALVTPAGVLLGGTMVPHITGSAVGWLTALATGTFLFVALCEMLPEVFHHREDALAKVALLAGGVAASILGLGLAG